MTKVTARAPSPTCFHHFYHWSKQPSLFIVRSCLRSRPNVGAFARPFRWDLTCAQRCCQGHRDCSQPQAAARLGFQRQVASVRKHLRRVQHRRQLERIMAFSGHSSEVTVPKHCLDASVEPSPDALVFFRCLQRRSRYLLLRSSAQLIHPCS